MGFRVREGLSAGAGQANESEEWSRHRDGGALDEQAARAAAGFFAGGTAAGLSGARAAEGTNGHSLGVERDAQELGTAKAVKLLGLIWPAGGAAGGFS